MDNRIASEAHPAFVEIIKQLDSTEARLLRSILVSPTDHSFPIVEVRSITAGESGWSVLQTHLLDLVAMPSRVPSEVSHVAAMVDNWIRLGLVTVDYASFLVTENAYGWVEGRPEYQRHGQQAEINGTKVTFAKGRLTCTSLGAQFARVAGLASSSM